MKPEPPVKDKLMTPEAMIQLFDRQPSPAIQDKINFYFMPYNSKTDCSKHMIFTEDKLMDQIEKLTQAFENNYFDMEPSQRVMMKQLIS